MTTVGSPRRRWVSILGLFMLVMSVTPAGVAAQLDLPSLGEVAQAEMGQGIELLQVDCEPGAPADPSDLIPGCTNGRAGLDITVTSTDPALGINQDKVSVKPSDPGPGVINTGQVPLGEYRVEIDLPTEDYRFFFECRTRGADTNNVDVRPAPDGAANAFLVNNNADVDVVCQAWVTPAGENPTLEITYRECNRSDFPSDDRSYEALRDNCTGVAENPPTFNVRELNVSGQPVTQHQLDAEGKLNLTLSPGNYDLFTDLDMNQYGEYLFCEYQDQPRYEKDFDPQRGITTFGPIAGQEITCDWFGVSAADEPGDADPIVPPAQDPPAAETDVQFTINYNTCTRGDFPSTDRGYQDLVDNCTYFEAPGPVFTIVNQDTSTEQLNLDANGVLTFTRSTEPFSIYTNLDPNLYGEYLWCSYDGNETYNKPFNDGGVNGFQNLIAGEVFTCEWFGVQAVDTPTEGDPPPVVEPETGATFNISMMACQAEEATWDTSSVDAFRTNCTFGNENVVLTLENNEHRFGAATLPSGEASFTDVPAGNWGLYSEIPMEFASEYYFCSTDGGAFTSIPLSERGVASFNDIDGQQINCEIYVVPENLRGEVTGSSVEVHLALCPNNYEGSAWYADCHDNGLDEYDFTLTGPAGEVTSNTVVERTPGPGIVRFNALPAGDYELRGGPPQHDGTVFLYCSDPVTNTQIDTMFEGGMGYFFLAENQNVVCDWYFTPTAEPPVTPTPEPELAEIFTTMFVCPPNVNVAGSTFSQLDSACSERLNDVPMTLQSPGGVPITANTGASGDGAIRFYDLTGGDYVLTPKLPAEYVSAAVYCDLDGGDVYQKALNNGATTFVSVSGELVSCSWFVTAKPQPAPVPTGSITIREMLCEGDRSSITDWERECQPGSSGASFTITSSGGGVNQTLTPNAEGVAVFTGLPNEYYEVKQSEGAWCRAQAERVDSQSRVIVSGGGNTDVFLYQCNQEIGLPDTGAGPAASGTPTPIGTSIMLGAGALPLFAAAIWQIRRSQFASVEANQVTTHEALTRTENGYRYR